MINGSLTCQSCMFLLIWCCASLSEWMVGNVIWLMRMNQALIVRFNGGFIIIKSKRDNSHSCCNCLNQYYICFNMNTLCPQHLLTHCGRSLMISEFANTVQKKIPITLVSAFWNKSFFEGSILIFFWCIKWQFYLSWNGE